MTQSTARPFELLVVEDNPGDVRLLRKALGGSHPEKVLHVVEDGAAALEFLRGSAAGGSQPDLVLLDLNLPRLSGFEVLAEMRADERLRAIPVVVFSSSEAPDDVRRAYLLHANSYVTKPGELDAFLTTIESLERFWLCTARLPR